MKYAVITGASKGFGKALAESFAKEGYSLLLCARGLPALQELSSDLQNQYPALKISYRSTDLSHKEETLAFAQWIMQEAATVDILINNAGRFIPGNIGDEPEGALEETINTNLYSAYYLTRALLPGMIKRKSGHIFNVCSIASLKAYPNGGAYSISKFALHGFSTNLRYELREHGIKVTSVFPGAAYTASWAGTGVDPQRIMESRDIADMMLAAAKLSPQACVEDIVLRPQLGDL